MATKYCDPSLATGLNDGTSTANAWQNLEQVLKNTMASGSYTAGDTIIIRSYNAGDITVTLSAGAIAQAVKGSAGNPVTWLVDNGTVWGTGGVLTIKKTDDNTYFTFSDYNIFDGGTVGGRNLVFRSDTGTNSRCFRTNAAVNGLNFRDALFDSYPTGANAVSLLVSLAPFNNVTFERCKFKHRAIYTGLSQNGIIVQNGSKISFIDPEFDYTSTVNSGNASSIIQIGTGYNIEVSIRGGKTVGTTSSHYIVYHPTIMLSSTSLAVIRSTAFNRGSAKPIGQVLIDTFLTATQVASFPHIVEENSLGTNNFDDVTPFGRITWEKGANYPVLNAVEPDTSATPWSMRVIPSNAVNVGNPVDLLTLNKFWNAAAATVTATLEMLIKDTSVVGGSGKYNSPQKNEWWVDVTYVNDADGSVVTESSKTTGALATSTAGWSTTGYGAQNYNKYKIAITTANSVKQDTVMHIVLRSSKSTNDATDFYFVDPDVTLA